MIISQLALPYIGLPDPTPIETPPSIPNTKHRIVWSEQGILQYRELLNNTFLEIQNNWKSSKTQVSYSVLLQCTNEALASAAKLTNKVIDLSKPRPLPKQYKPAEKAKKDTHSTLKNTLSNPSATTAQIMHAKKCFNDARKDHRQTWRREQASKEHERDQKLSSFCSKDSSEAFKHLKSVCATSSSKISEIHVGNKVFTGDNVSAGFYENIKTLKTEHDPATKNCESCKSFKFDHKLILEICKYGEKIPPLSLSEAEKLLHSLKPSVCDHWSISA